MPCPTDPIQISIARRPGPSSSSSPHLRDWRYIQVAVALTFAVPVVELQASTRRGSDAAIARQAAMYIARVVLGLSYAAIGRLCRRDHKTVAHACRVVEQRREDPALNRTLRALEELCEDLLAGRPHQPRRRA